MMDKFQGPVPSENHQFNPDMNFQEMADYSKLSRNHHHKSPLNKRARRDIAPDSRKFRNKLKRNLEKTNDIVNLQYDKDMFRQSHHYRRPIKALGTLNKHQINRRAIKNRPSKYMREELLKLRDHYNKLEFNQNNEKNGTSKKPRFFTGIVSPQDVMALEFDTNLV